MHRLLRVAAVAAGVLACASAVRAGDDPARAIVRAAADRFEVAYTYPSRGTAVAAALRANAASGAYDNLRDAALASRVTADIAAVLHDKHARLLYSENPPAAAQPAGRPDADRGARDAGYGLGRIAHLPGNVGYIDLRGFSGSPEADSVIDAAVAAVAGSDAIVLDLRRNHGGSPLTVARLLSHFLAPNITLNEFVGRSEDDRVVSSTSTQSVPGPHLDAALYVLTSAETVSAGEECAYDLQVLKRGVLIGEVTAGGANPGGITRLDDHFSVFVPTGRAHNPVTKTNWEGTGVHPDVTIGRDRALVVAYGRAIDAKLLDGSSPSPRRLTELRAAVNAMSDAEILAL